MTVDDADIVAVFDIGSSRFRYALGTSNGDFLTDVESTATAPERLEVQVVDAVSELSNRTPRQIDAVAISCSGLIDAKNTTVEEMDTRDGGRVFDIQLGVAVREAFSLPTYLDNDCNTAVIGEWAFGTDGDYSCIVHVTIGTGIGAGVIDHGQLLRGESGQAAEVGYLPIADEDQESFGVPGAWEACCSGRGIPSFVEHLLGDETRDTDLHDIEDLTAKHVFDAANRGDMVANEYLDRISRYNAAGLGAIANLHNPGLITLGGGVTLNNRERVLNGVRKHLGEFVFVDRPDIEITPLEGNIGMYGAMALPELRTKGRLAPREQTD